MKTSYFIPLLIVFLLVACVQNTEIEEETQCIDESLIDETAACYLIYAPVCGCDGTTYSNDCVATTNGVLTFEEGACEEE